MWGFSIHRTWDSGARLPRYIKLAKSKTTCREIRNLFCGFTFFTSIPQNWYWPFQVQYHTQAACSSPVCLFQEQERRHRQWRWGQGSCRRPRRQRGRGTWRGRSRWTSPRSWECQEFHTRMCRPDLLNKHRFTNGFTYRSHNHTIQWMPEQPNCLKGVQGERCFFEVENTCAGTVEKWQKENAYMSQMHVTNPGNETYEWKWRTARMTYLKNQRRKEDTLATQ